MAVPKAGWGLTPGALESNVSRSLGGAYGAVGNSPQTVSNMMRQKHAAGLQAKQAKEGFDLTRAAEANRKSESTRAFGLATEKFGFEKEDAAKRWADLVRGRELQAEAMRGGWSQQELDRALREEQLEAETGWRTADREQRASEYDRGLAQRGSEYDRTLAQRGSEFSQNLSQRGSEYDRSLDLDNRELESLDSWRKRSMEEAAAQQAATNTRYEQENNYRIQQAAYRAQQDALDRQESQAAEQRARTQGGSQVSPTGALSPQPSYTWKTSPGGTRYRVDNNTGKVFV